MFDYKNLHLIPLADKENFSATIAPLTFVKDREEIPLAAHECDIWLIRHGESESNAAIHDKDKIRIAGRKYDCNLSLQGKEQAQKVGEIVKSQLKDVAAFYSSTLIRAKQTAEILQKIFSSSGALSTAEGLIETYYGSLEGASGHVYDPAEEKMKATLPQLSNLEERMNYRMVEDMESNREVFHRLTETIEDLAKHHLGKSIVCVTHNGGIKSLFMHLLARDFGKEVMYHRFSVGNCAILRLRWDGSTIHLSNIHNISMR